MMIDTLRTSKKLLENGFSPQQSEVLVDVIAQHNEELATKQDIQFLRKDIHAQSVDIQSLKTAVQTQSADIQSLKTDVQELKTAVQTQSADIQSLKTDVQELKTAVQTQSASIQSLKESMEKSHSIIFWILGVSIPVIIGTMVTLLIFLLNTFIN